MHALKITVGNQILLTDHEYGIWNLFTYAYMYTSVSFWQGEIDSRKDNFTKIRQKGEVSTAVYMCQYHVSLEACH